MCLITDKIEPLVAEKDIVCYKLVEVGNLKHKGHRQMPFIGTKILESELNGKSDFKAEGMKEVNISTIDGDTKIIVNGGFIHTFCTVRDAKKMVKPYLTKFPCSTLELYKCKIPSGDFYYKGKDSNGFKTFASNRIIFSELVNVM